MIGERVHVRQLLKEAKHVCNYTRYSACWSDVELRELWLEYKDAALIMCVYMCMYVCMYVAMYVYMYVYGISIYVFRIAWASFTNI